MKKLIISAAAALTLALLMNADAETARAEKAVFATNGTKISATVYVDKEYGCEYLLISNNGSTSVTLRHKNGVPACKQVSAASGKK